MPDARHLIFHIGLEKTGTTSLQAFLHKHEAVLASHDVVYPRRHLAYGYRNHAPLVACYMDDDAGDKWVRVAPRRRTAVVASLRKAIATARGRTAVISSEHFSSRLREEGIAKLRADFGSYDCRVVIVLRDHFSRLCSSYVTYVINGGCLTLEAFAEGAMRPEANDLRYADLIEPWARIFGRDRLFPIVYGPNVLADVLANISPGLQAVAHLQSQRLKASAGPDVVAAIRLVNTVAARPICDNYLEWLKAQQLRAQIKSWLLDVAQKSAARPAWALDHEILQPLMELAAADTAQLKSRFDIDLPPPVAAAAADDDEPVDPAELLGRALLSRATKPWTLASLRNAWLAIGVPLRDTTSRLRERIAAR